MLNNISYQFHSLMINQTLINFEESEIQLKESTKEDIIRIMPNSLELVDLSLEKSIKKIQNLLLIRLRELESIIDLTFKNSETEELQEYIDNIVDTYNATNNECINLGLNSKKENNLKLQKIIHDLKNNIKGEHVYITQILSNLNIIDGNNYEAFLDSIDKLIDSTKNNLEIIEYLSPGEENKINRPNHLLKVNKELERIFIWLKTQAEAKGIILNLNLKTENTDSIAINKNFFDSLLKNLFINSEEASVNEENKLEINIDIYKVQNNLIVEFSDNGPGMSSEIVQKINDSTVYSNKKDGTGIGLSTLSREIKDEIGGTWSVDSQLKMGSTFIIQLPLSNIQGVTIPNKLNSDQKELIKQVRALIIDDEENIGSSIKISLKQLGIPDMNITVVKNTKEAFAHIQTSRSRLEFILSDQHLSPKDILGSEFLKQIIELQRKEEYEILKGTSVHLISGSGKEKEASFAVINKNDSNSINDIVLNKVGYKKDTKKYEIEPIINKLEIISDIVDSSEYNDKSYPDQKILSKLKVLKMLIRSNSDIFGKKDSNYTLKKLEDIISLDSIKTRSKEEKRALLKNISPMIKTLINSLEKEYFNESLIDKNKTAFECILNNIPSDLRNLTAHVIQGLAISQQLNNISNSIQKRQIELKYKNDNELSIVELFDKKIIESSLFELEYLNETTQLLINTDNPVEISSCFETIYTGIKNILKNISTNIDNEIVTLSPLTHDFSNSMTPVLLVKETEQLKKRIPKYFKTSQTFIKDLKTFHENNVCENLPNCILNNEDRKSKFSILYNLYGPDIIDLFYNKLSKQVNIDDFLREDLNIEEIINITEKANIFNDNIKFSLSKVRNMQNTLKKILEESDMVEKSIIGV